MAGAILPPQTHSLHSLVKEIVIVSGGEVIFSTRLAAERFAVTDFLQVVQAAGDAFIAVAVESIEVDGSTAIDAGVDFRPFEDMLAVSIDDAGFCSGISIDKEAVLVSFITRTFHITVTKRRFDGFKSRYGAAVALQFALALGV